MYTKVGNIAVLQPTFYLSYNNHFSVSMYQDSLRLTLSCRKSVTSGIKLYLCHLSVVVLLMKETKSEEELQNL